MTDLGTVSALRRYPVKSMLGEVLHRCVVTERGFDGDRTHALIDVETGKVATAKRPHLWRGLLGFRVARDDAGVRITLPNGQRIADGQAEVDALLSEAIGRRVTLSAVRAPGASVERARPEEVLEKGVEDAGVIADPLELAQAAPLGGFFDYAPVAVLTSASLARIAEAAAGEPIALERYRPNIVIETPDLAPFAENEWRGRVMRIGQNLVLRMDIPTPRCAIPMLAYADVPAAPGAVSTVARLNRAEVPELGPGTFPCLGAFAVVIAPGEAKVGDAARLED